MATQVFFYKRKAAWIIFYLFLSITVAAQTSRISCWLTKSDRSNLFIRQDNVPQFGTASSTGPVINVDDSKKFQTIEGFGFALTGGSAPAYY